MMATTRKGKTAQILEHLQKYGSITPLEAMLKYKSMRLSGVIYRLKHEDGHPISTVMETDPDSGAERSTHDMYGMADET